MELNSIRDSFDRVIKKQKLSYSKSQEVIDHVLCEVTDALSKIKSSSQTIPINKNSLLLDLKNKIASISHRNMLEGILKELNTEVIKYIKYLEKNLNPDISKSYRNIEFDSKTVNQIVICHFYREGLFEIGDKLAEEAGEIGDFRSQYWEMHRILDSMKVKNLDPALKWVVSNRMKLNGSGLELKLHRLQFMEILQKKGSKVEALNYARTYLSPFASIHMDEVQKLMGSLLWQDKLGCSPYSELMDPQLWDRLADELTAQFCCLMGQSFKSPLNIVVAAGFEGLSTLLKLANVMAAKKQEWQEIKQLPVPVDLGKDFQFHSIFVCPVSRDQATEENPPMILPCGHVLCKQSIVKLSKSSTRSFKCPYCPVDAFTTQCRQLYF